MPRGQADCSKPARPIGAALFESLERRNLWCGYHLGTLPADMPATGSALAAPPSAAAPPDLRQLASTQHVAQQPAVSPRIVGGGWSYGTQLPVGVGEIGAGVIGNRLYVVSQATRATLTYDLVARRWSTTAAPARLVHGDHHAAEVVNGKLYLIGGLTEYKGTTAPAGRVQIYNPATNRWSFGADLPWKGGSVSTAVIGGKIYAAGGIVNSRPGAHAGTGSTTQAARYDPATNRWTILPPMPRAANHAAGGTGGSKFFIFGGRGGGSVLTNGFATTQMFNPATNRWVSSDTSSAVRPLPVARGGMGKAAFHNGEFYVFGGETLNGPGATPNRVYDRVDIYNATTGSWRRGSPIPTAVHGTSPVKWGNKIYLPGGGTIAAYSQSRLLQVYTPG